jgi:hypothetical protein
MERPAKDSSSASDRKILTIVIAFVYSPLVLLAVVAAAHGFLS